MIFLNTMTTEDLLTEWGQWSVAGLGLTLSTSSDEWRWVTIDDDTALVIDRAVAQLGVSKFKCEKKNQGRKLQCIAVKLYYRNELSYKEIGNRINVGETKARSFVISGHDWIDGYLDALRTPVNKVA
jgi:hypothetical protein